MINPNLKGKTILITGANSGIGSACALKFGEMGANVIVHYLDAKHEIKGEGFEQGHTVNGKKAALKVVEDIKKLGQKAVAIDADLKNADEAKQLFHESLKAFGSLDILVNNAAHCSFPDNIFETNEASISNHFDVNTKASVLLIHHFVKNHKQQGKKSGSIINISTDAAQNFPNQISYGASKAALESYTRSIANEIGKLGITINCVSPGPVQTGYLNKEMEEFLVPQIPMRRIGVPEDIVNAVIFFASDQSRWITGQVLLVSGGHYI